MLKYFRVKQRMYRGLLPPVLLTRFGIDPIQWTDSNSSKEQRVFLKADEDSQKVLITAQSSSDAADEFLALELADNSLNGIELNRHVEAKPECRRSSQASRARARAGPRGIGRITPRL